MAHSRCANARTLLAYFPHLHLSQVLGHHYLAHAMAVQPTRLINTDCHNSWDPCLCRIVQTDSSGTRRNRGWSMGCSWRRHVSGRKKLTKPMGRRNTERWSTAGSTTRVTRWWMMKMRMLITCWNLRVRMTRITQKKSELWRYDTLFTALQVWVIHLS
jgi:hypothetical protein